ncbi:RAMP superfamily CRISPR-associated protein [Oryzibacter oryziterrae]|uniref:RAMP superfamily CRISPR-associated protein n=1 Tax=Oryzibacter oryziterrae TaxID=2766474 RepID=UPI001F3AF0AA|nr:RAMP superfamily CRISPR-associated protein [Oryzibacter oryziterrae]
MSISLRIPQPNDESGRTVRFPLVLATHALVSGAEANCPELRLSSILGLLRFWWRATSPLSTSSNKLLDREVQLFGGPATGDDKSNQGTGCFTASVEWKGQDGLLGFKSNSRGKPGGNLESFLGYGVQKNRRNGLLPGLVGELTIRFRSNAGPDSRAEILRAVEYLLHFGGIGLLSRRGLGSLQPSEQTLAKDTLVSKLQALVSAVSQNAKTSDIPTFSKASRVLFLPEEAKIGRDALHVIADDAVAFASFLSGKGVNGVSPDNIFAEQRGNQRAPSPLFIKIFSYLDGNGAEVFGVLLTYLPTTFVNAHENIMDYMGSLVECSAETHAIQIKWSP